MIIVLYYIPVNSCSLGKFIPGCCTGESNVCPTLRFRRSNVDSALALGHIWPTRIQVPNWIVVLKLQQIRSLV